MDAAFYRPLPPSSLAAAPSPAEFRVASTPATRGPWDDRFQHGGPPAALMGSAMARFGDDAEDFALARLDVALLRPVPIAELAVTVSMERPGRTAQRLSATMRAGDQVVATARGLRIRRADVPVPAPTPPPHWDAPETLPIFTFPFFQNDVGYHRAVELRLAHGQWGRTPVGFWARPTVQLLEGRETSPLEALLVLADAQSGMGVPLDPLKYTFANPDLTVYLTRLPRGTWFGFDIHSTAGPEGVGLAQSALRDEDGELGRSAQSLVIVPR